MAKELKIELIVDAATGTATIKSFADGTTAHMKQVEGAGTSMGAGLVKTWQGVAVAAAAAMGVMYKAWGLAEKAAKFEEMEAGLQGLSARYGMTADSAVEMAKAAVGGQLSMMEAGQLAAKAFALGFNPDQVKQFLVVSERLTDVMGGTIPEAFNAMEKAAATGRKGGLVGIGINVDLKKTLSDYADAHGIAKDSIGAHTATLLRANAIMAEAKKITDQMGEATESTADKMNKMRATVADIELMMGQFSIRGGAAVIGTLTGITAAGWAVAAGFLKIGEGITYLISVLPGAEAADKQLFESMKANADAAWETSKDATKKTSDQLYVAFADRKVISSGIKKLQDEETENFRLNKETEKALNDLTVKNFNEMVKIQTEFEAAYAKMTMTTEQVAIQSLNVKLAYFQQEGINEIRLEEYKQAGLRDIMIKADNEQITLWEELYKETQDDRYAKAAIDAMKEILDAEEKKWAKILNRDADAHTIRLKREQKYTDKVKGMIGEITNAESVIATTIPYSRYDSGSGSTDVAAESATTRVNAYGETETMSRSGLGWIIGQGSGATGGPSYIRERWPTDPPYVNAAATTAAATAAAEAAKVAQEIATTNENIAAQYQQELDARKAAHDAQVSAFQSAYGGYTSYMQEKTRSTWGQKEYQGEFSRLSSEFANSSYFETSIDLLGQMLDIAKKLETIEQAALDQQMQTSASLKDSSKSISDWLADLSQGALSPVQSAGEWATRFEELRSAAMADATKTADFLTYAQKYLEFEKAYGTSGSYNTAYQSTTSAVAGLGGYQNLLSQLADLGLGGTTGDLNKLVTAFGNLGISVTDLQKAAETATMGSMKDLAHSLGITLPDTALAANIATGTISDNTGHVVTNTKTNLDAVASMWDTLALKIGGASAGVLAGLNAAYTSYTTNPPATGHLVTTGWTMQSGFPQGWGTYVVYYNGAQIMPPTSSFAGPPAPYQHMEYFAQGGLTKGRSIAGESGPEWVVPTYEPQRSNFLKAVGADEVVVGKAIARELQGMGGGGDIHRQCQGMGGGGDIHRQCQGMGGGGDITLEIYVDGERMLAKKIRQGGELTAAIDNRVRVLVH